MLVFGGVTPSLKKADRVFDQPERMDFRGFFLIFFSVRFECPVDMMFFQFDIFGRKASTILEIPSSNLTQHFGLLLWVFADSPGIECFYIIFVRKFWISLCGKSFKRQNVPRSF